MASIVRRRQEIEERVALRRATIREEIIAERKAEEEEDKETLIAIQKAALWEPTAPERNATSLLDQAYVLKKSGVIKPEQEKMEEVLEHEANMAQGAALRSVIGKQMAFNDDELLSRNVTWKPPSWIQEWSEEECDKVRKKYHIVIEGNDIPPPIAKFKNMRFPPVIVNALRSKSIITPTPIQIQGMPCILSGRDTIGIAFTGSGKTLTFTLPLVLLAWEEEEKMPLVPREGPFGILLGPSRELMRQTLGIVQHFTNALAAEGYPKLRSLLLIGGEKKNDQVASVVNHGVHIVVATPGRLKDLLGNKQMNLRLCKYIVLDEADRLLDLGFDEEIREIFTHFTHPRQTLLFSATMPQKVQEFVKNVLVSPIMVNVGRAGSACLHITQTVHFVAQEDKLRAVLQCLQQTAPPVLIFCERKGEVDDIHECLLLKGVAAASIHGGKDQMDRTTSMTQFAQGDKDVLVATDIAAKGLDFPDIQHVINYGMPSEIENYVHRIGRTGRRGQKGRATTLVDRNVEESTLLDLKHLLVEAKQQVPTFLLEINDPRSNIRNTTGGSGCSFCGGLGHRITDCPKLDSQSRKLDSDRRDFLGGQSQGYGGDAMG